MAQWARLIAESRSVYWLVQFVVAGHSHPERWPRLPFGSLLAITTGNRLFLRMDRGSRGWQMTEGVGRYEQSVAFLRNLDRIGCVSSISLSPVCTIGSIGINARYRRGIPLGKTTVTRIF